MKSLWNNFWLRDKSFPLNFRFIIGYQGIEMIFISQREMISLMAYKNAAAVRFKNNVMYAFMDSMVFEIMKTNWFCSKVPLELKWEIP